MGCWSFSKPSTSASRGDPHIAAPPSTERDKPVTTELDKLDAVLPDLADGFRSIRREALTAGPLANETVELIVVATLAATNRRGPLRVHINRLLDMGVEPAAIRHALAASFGAATTLTETVDGLGVLADCVENYAGRSESAS